MVAIEDYKVNPTKKIIDDIDIQIVYIPLESKSGIQYEQTVKPGEYVYIGSTVGKSKISDIQLLSSVSGTVVGYQNKYISNGHITKCIVIENDFKDKYLNKSGKKNDITKYTKNEFIELLKNCSISGLSGTGYPTYSKYEKAKEVKYLIINGAECDIYCSSDNAVMYNYTEEILEAIDAIMEIMNIPKAYIAINEKNSKIINRFLKYINTYPNIKIYPLVNAYPNGYERYIISSILSLKYNNSPEEVGIVCQNISTIYSIYEALKYRKPLIERIVTISGQGIKKAANYKLKIGTNLNEIFMKTDILKNVSSPVLVAGGALMGTSIESDEFIITPDVNCILILESVDEKPSPCIRCGKCSEVCPMNLIPSMLIDNKNKDNQISKCIECSLCSYICPSKIEICEIIKQIKEKKSE